MHVEIIQLKIHIHLIEIYKIIKQSCNKNV